MGGSPVQCITVGWSLLRWSPTGGILQVLVSPTSCTFDTPIVPVDTAKSAPSLWAIGDEKVDAKRIRSLSKVVVEPSSEVSYQTSLRWNFGVVNGG